MNTAPIILEFPNPKTPFKVIGGYGFLIAMVVFGYFLLSLKTTFGYAMLGLTILQDVYRVYSAFRLHVYPQSLRMMEKQLHVRTANGTEVYAFSQIRSIKKNRFTQQFCVKFTNWRFIPELTGPEAEAFLTELSARSGVEIKQ